MQLLSLGYHLVLIQLFSGESSRVSHDITQDDITPAKKRKRSRSRWSRGLPPRKSRKCSENEQVMGSYHHTAVYLFIYAPH